MPPKIDITSDIEASTQKKSAFKNMTGKKWKSGERHENIQIGSGHKLSNLIKANGTYFCTPWTSSSGILSYRKITDFGKWDDLPVHIIYAHGKGLTDFAISPLKDTNVILTSGSGESIAKLWKVSESPKTELSRADMELVCEDGATINRVHFHPKVGSLAFVGQQSGYFSFFDLVNNKQMNITKSPSLVDDSSWSTDGTILMTGHEKKFRLWDIRGQSMIAECESHASVKPNCVQWTTPKGLDRLFTVGFDKMGNREWTCWDYRSLKDPLIRTQIDSGASSQIFPFYDSDTDVMYFSGKGDRDVKILQVSESTPYLDYMTDFKTDNQNAALAMLPKDVCNILNVEVNRFLKVTNEQTVEVVSMSVMKNQTISKYFQEDIFPDTWERKSVLSVEDYFGGKPVVLNKISLKPQGVTSIFDAPEEEGGKPQLRNVKSPALTSLTKTKSKASMVEEEQEFQIIKEETVKDTKIVTEKGVEKFTQVVEMKLQKVVWNKYICGFIAMMGLAVLIKFPRLWMIILASTLAAMWKFGRWYVDYVETMEEEAERQKEFTKNVISHRKVFKTHTEKRKIVVPQKGGDSTEPVTEEIEVEVSDDPRTGCNIMTQIGDPPMTKEELMCRDSDKLLALEVDCAMVRKGTQKILMMVRGRTNCRMTIVQAHTSSLYGDTSYILPSGDNIFVWHGKKANKFQKAKTLDIVQTMKFKDRGGNANVVFLEEGKEDPKFEKEFWKCLQGEKPTTTHLHPFGELDYFKVIDADIRLYRVVNALNENQMLIDVDCKGTLPVKEVLQSDGCYIYATSNEFYYWVGKKSDPTIRKWTMAICKRMANVPAKTGFATYSKIIQDAEIQLFKEKFLGWGGAIAQAKDTGKETAYERRDQKMLDVDAMYKFKLPHEEPLDLSIPGKLKIQRVDLEKKTFVDYPEELFGHFFMSDAFLVVYTYQKTLGGKEWTIVYFWQGRDSRRKARGAAAFGAVKLADEYDSATQVRVVQAKEPLSFLQLFKKKYVCHLGSYRELEKNDRFYHVKGSPLVQDSTCCVQLDATKECYFTPNGCFLTKDFIWKGSKSTEEEIDCAVEFAKILKFEQTIILQGEEPDEFKSLFPKYCLITDTRPRIVSRLFGFWVSATIDNNEIYKIGQVDLMPDQCYIMDSHPYLYAWIGKSASSDVKRYCLQVAIEYSKRAESTYNEKPIMKIVIQDKEPVEFMLNFHAWTNSNWSLTANECDDLEKELDKITVKTLTYAFLKECVQKSQFPEGVDPARIEKFLTPEEFQSVFNMNMEEFEKLAVWKQNEARKKANLF